MKEQFSSESVEWYTPAKYTKAVRAVLGSIELDPASCEAANKTVNAERFFTIEDDGFARHWDAYTLFLNPPYGKEGNVSRQALWSRKLIQEFDSGRTKEAILLVNACTSERWFQPLWAYPICFTDHRIKFDRPSESAKKDGPTKGNAFIYFGCNVARFAEIFEQFGAVVHLAKAA